MKKQFIKVESGLINYEFSMESKKEEIAMFRRGQKIIESCVSDEQLDTAHNFVALMRKENLLVANALFFLLESKRLEIQDFNISVMNLNVIYEKVTKDN